MIMWDRVKVVVLLGTFLAMTAAYKQSRIPIMSYGEALWNQLQAKWWIVAVMGLEVLRQVHYLVSERSAGWHRFWQKKVFGGWERRMSRLNPWNRYRLQRAVKFVLFVVLAGYLLAWLWDLPWIEATTTAPARLFDALFVNPVRGLPLFFTIALGTLTSLVYLVFFFGIFFIGGVETFKPGEVKTRFADIWGQDHVVRRVQESIDYLERPKEIEGRGGHVPAGILLWGPPGTGKTLMAEAVAGETGKPYVFVDPSAFIQTFMGVAPMKIKWMYRKLRKLALRHGGVIVFFDEADSLGNRGSLGQPTKAVPSPVDVERRFGGLRWVSEGSRQFLLRDAFGAPAAAADPVVPRPKRIVVGNMGGGGMGALQSLLTEMSGLNKPRGFFSRRVRSFLNIKAKQPPKYRMLHVFATNQPNALDQALLRPGRIDRIYKVGYPSAEGRRRTFEGYLNRINHTVTPQQIERLSVITPYFTGAKVKALVNEALMRALRDGRDTVTWADLLGAKYTTSHGDSTDMKFTALERHQVAIHEACHAVAMYRLQKRAVIDVATIDPRDDYLGMVAPVPIEERFSDWKSDFEIDVMTFLASLAGERMFFDGDNSAGVSGDLRSATAIVMAAMSFYGMGGTIASRQVTVGGMLSVTAVNEDGSDRAVHDSQFGARVEAKLQELFERVEALLAENRRFVLAIAHALETHQTITGDDVHAIFTGRPGPTLDGWVYHTDDFLLSYEAYHLAAVEAHRNQDRHWHALPTLGHRPVPAGRAYGPPTGGYGSTPPPPPPPPPLAR